MARITHIINLFLLFSSTCLIASSNADIDFGIYVWWAQCDRREYFYKDIHFAMNKACDQLNSKLVNSIPKFQNSDEMQREAPVKIEIGNFIGPFYSFPLTSENVHNQGNEEDFVILNTQCQFFTVIRTDYKYSWSNLKKVYGKYLPCVTLSWSNLIIHTRLIEGTIKELKKWNN